MSKAHDQVKDNVMETVIKEMVIKSMPYKTVFATEEGKKVLLDLKQEFRKLSVAASTPHETVIRAAQYDVLDYIEKMINIKSGEKDEIT